MVPCGRYVLRELGKTAATGRPLNRPLWWDFPADDEAWETDDAYMFGDDYVAAPVLKAGARSRLVYLPRLAGSGAWVHHFTNTSYPGGAVYNVAAPLGSFPLFRRHGAAPIV